MYSYRWFQSWKNKHHKKVKHSLEWSCCPICSVFSKYLGQELDTWLHSGKPCVFFQRLHFPFFFRPAAGSGGSWPKGQFPNVQVTLPTYHPLVTVVLGGEWAGCLRVALVVQGSKLDVCIAAQASLKMRLFLLQGYPGGKYQIKQHRDI